MVDRVVLITKKGLVKLDSKFREMKVIPFPMVSVFSLKLI
jgi:hypothetical protein